ncbi:DUF4878 domain-containing protein [Bacillus subtilis]|uniref:DUF4878 domain-containing protein n=1 Tax=Bacillus subtilis TaxID=1423 RepID=UPI001389C1C5|nr:DUF4878 domain-containing protein [Bacillus subtilis]MCM3189479.1 DUF4878 domain-containing protein [Bacillus subtilis]NDK01976.1 hypothetical protein [Bacillus subtilis subsp. subtilis]
MKKLFSSLIVLLVFSVVVTSATTSVSAVSANNTPESTLEEYLTSVKNENVDQMMDLVIDERDISKEEYKDMLETEKLTDYEIIKAKQINENKHYYVVKASYNSGLVTEVPLEVKKVNSDWKVNINDETLNSDDNKTLDQGDQEYYNKIYSLKQEKAKATPQDVLIWWNFDSRVGGKTFYSKRSFSVPNTKSLKLGIYTQLSTSPNTTSITYAVVRKNALGDNVWGSRKVNGHIYGDKFYTVSGKSKTFKGAQLRFTPHGSATYSGNGGLDW